MLVELPDAAVSCARAGIGVTVEEIALGWPPLRSKPLLEKAVVIDEAVVVLLGPMLDDEKGNSVDEGEKVEDRNGFGGCDGEASTTPGSCCEKNCCCLLDGCWYDRTLDWGLESATSRSLSELEEEAALLVWNDLGLAEDVDGDDDENEPSVGVHCWGCTMVVGGLTGVSVWLLALLDGNKSPLFSTLGRGRKAAGFSPN